MSLHEGSNKGSIVLLLPQTPASPVEDSGPTESGFGEGVCPSGAAQLRLSEAVCRMRLGEQPQRFCMKTRLKKKIVKKMGVLMKLRKKHR